MEGAAEPHWEQFGLRVLPNTCNARLGTTNHKITGQPALPAKPKSPQLAK